VWSGAATCSRVSPLCPFWPPQGLSDGPRRLLVRAARGGFLSPSLDGGLPLLEQFRKTRFQCRDFGRLGRHQRYQLFLRRPAARIRIIHRILESKPDSAVEENLPHSLQRNLSTWAVTPWEGTMKIPDVAKRMREIAAQIQSNFPDASVELTGLADLNAGIPVRAP
jgi:hypothetical protein